MTLRAPVRLSKSKIAAFEHCPRRLWLQVHRRHVARYDPDTLLRFQIGHDVGRLATLAFPNGVMVDAVPDIQAAIDRTAALTGGPPRQPIFEATFLYQNVLVRVDILEPDQAGAWRAIEVKASSRVKPYQLADIATQVWVMRGSGISVSKAAIRHLAAPINWRRPDIASVRFQDSDVTRPIGRYVSNRRRVAEAAATCIAGPEVQRDIGPHCGRPFPCEFQAHCAEAHRSPLLARCRSSTAR